MLICVLKHFKVLMILEYSTEWRLQVEETVTMVITGIVVNPGTSSESVLSMQEAVERGLLDLEHGVYRNSVSGEELSFVEAMNCGYIKVTQLI